MIEKSVLSQVVEYTIYDDIKEFSTYKDFLNDIKSFGPDDKLILKVNSPGGRVDVGFMIVDALRDCKAHTKSIITHEACSMGAIIALATNELELAKNTFLMLHDYSTICYGKGNDLSSQTSATRKMWESRFIDICSPFLTHKECEKVLKGQDFYIHDDDPSLKQRLSRHRT